MSNCERGMGLPNASPHFRFTSPYEQELTSESIMWWSYNAKLYGTLWHRWPITTRIYSHLMHDQIHRFNASIISSISEKLTTHSSINLSVWNLRVNRTIDTISRGDSMTITCGSISPRVTTNTFAITEQMTVTAKRRSLWDHIHRDRTGANTLSVTTQYDSARIGIARLAICRKAFWVDAVLKEGALMRLRTNYNALS